MAGKSRSSSVDQSIAIFAHSHPFFSKGGGEIVAYNSFDEFKSRGFNVSIYSGINPSLRPQTKIFHPGEHLIEYADGELLFSSAKFDNFSHTHSQLAFFESVAHSLETRKTKVVHLHHFWNVGTDLILFLMARLPDVVYAITLHELLAICYRDGQMVKTTGNALCYKSGDIDCHLCFPAISRDEFKLRHDYLRSFLDKFDIIISPSDFLASRFTEWGLQKDIYVLENGYVRPEEDRVDLPAEALSRNFAFFGQPTYFKGVELFVAAAARCLLANRRDMNFSLYGCDRAGFLDKFGSQWAPILEKAGAYINFHGVYEPGQVFDLMRQNGYIVVPSTWWENSPLVIQEAYLAGRPPIVANIGGMAEKVMNGVSGLHFNVRNSGSLADVMTRAAGDSKLWETLRKGRVLPPTMSEMNDAHLELYQTASIVKRRANL